ncbi:MAG: YwiC-like family protein [Bacteroidota bacterium]
MVDAVKDQKDKSTWFRYILPPDPGIWIVFIVPIVSGVALAKTIDPAVILFLLTATALLFAQNPLRVAFVKRRECWEHRPARAALSALAILGAVGIICVAILLFAYHLWMLLPLGIFAVGTLFLHACQVERNKHKSPFSQLIGLFALTSNGFSVTYVSWKLPSSAGLMIWLITFVVFAVSIANMNFQSRLKYISPQRIRLQRRLRYAFPALVGNVGMVVVAALFYRSGDLPLISISATGMLAVYTVGMIIVSDGTFVRHQIGQRELLALSVWGCLFAAGVLGMDLHF